MAHCYCPITLTTTHVMQEADNAKILRKSIIQLNYSTIISIKIDVYKMLGHFIISPVKLSRILRN